MASFWRHIYFREALKKDFQENFCGKSLNAELKESALLQVNNLLGKLETEEQRNKENEKMGENKKYDNFVSALDTLLSLWEYAATNSSDPEKKEQRDMVEVYVECIARGSRIIFLSGEWMQFDSFTKSHLEKRLYKVKEQVPASSSTVEGDILFINFNQ
ncbi:uncharacterized protein LOC111700784 [Eurytemora carolleeae]|uniref:uncharacterized protein LOC111700784 n=1 Tax=Eurytemora carolleeae TaxID=1294199 RepID=UPI000C7748F8|nr:uncharacterized protein LOC111700784 [Eurytemora carolleeae]|eukprot:XP_023327591.1 uncharacterized protein LOC111700784 [Eurytemora affinis]